MLLHLTTYLQGGAGRAVTDLALAQHRAGRPVAVVAARTAVPGFDHYPEFVDRLHRGGVRTLFLDSTFSRDPVDNLTVVEGVCDAFGADLLTLIHAHAGTPARLGLQLADRSSRRLPVVQTMHGWGTNKTPEQGRDDLSVLRRVDRVVVTSDVSGDELVARGLGREHLVTIPCGLARERPAGWPVHPVAAEAVAVRAAGGVVLLSIGSIGARKNQRLLIEVMPRVLAKRPAICVCVGEGPDIVTLEARAHELGVGRAVRLVGYQPEAARWLPLADLLVQPSCSEGQDLAVIEAFRAGVPVVASGIGAHRELMTDGTTGWLFTHDAPPDLERALDEALTASAATRAGIVAAARARFEARYTLDAMEAAHERLYEDVCGRGTS